MRAKEFAEMCYEEKEIQLKEYMNGNESLVAKLKNELALSNKQEKILYELLDTVLTDTYITLLYALDGTASLGNGKQENFKLYGEDGNLVFNSGELEIATYEAFYENKE
ncbi:Phage protein [Fusobacterium sp. oral taxon C10]